MLHSLYSNRSFQYIQANESCGNEKEQVLAEGFYNSLPIMDKGYVADNIEDSITNTNGNNFLIKENRNIAGTVPKSQEVNDRLGAKYTGRKASQLQKYLLLD